MCQLAYAATCPTGQAKDEAALVQIEQTWVRALQQHDVAALNCILADEFEEAGPTGTLWDRSHMLARAADQKAVHYELAEMHGDVYEDAGYVRGMGAAINDGGQHVTKTRFTDIFVYRDGRWQCVGGHESVISKEK